MALVHAQRLILKKHDGSLQLYGVLYSPDLASTWWWVQSTLVLLTNSLEEGTIVATNADGEANLMVLVGLKTIEPGLDSLDSRVDGEIVLQDQVYSVGGHPTSLCHEYSLAILMESDIRQPICM